MVGIWRGGYRRLRQGETMDLLFRHGPGESSGQLEPVRVPMSLVDVVHSSLASGRDHALCWC
jgi:hypothetical protein